MDFNGLRVLLYVRVSTEEQARHGESVQDQMQALAAWAEQHHCHVIGTYTDEGFSARKPYHTRPALRDLLAAVEQRRADCVVFTKLDRWFRNLKDYYKVDEILQRHGVFWAAILEDYETRTSGGRFKVNLMLSIAEHEADQTSERIRFTFQQKRLRGEIISGNMPRGYRLEDGKPVKDPSEAPAVTAFWRTYLDGGSLSEAIDAYEAHGKTLEPSSASYILRNAASYAGVIQGVQVEPYITEDERDKILSTRRRAPRRTDRTYLYRGILVCGVCGGKLGGHKQHTNDNIFYNCARRYSVKRRLCTNSVNIYERDIEAYLLANIEGVVKAAAVRAEAHSKTDTRASTEKRRKAAIAKRDRLTEMYIDGRIDRESFDRRVAVLDAEIAAAPKKQKSPEAVRNLLPKEWRSAYSDLDAEHRRAFWHRVLRKIEVMPDRTIRFEIDD